MRSAETAARGSSTAMNVAMSTAIKIWMRYVRKAVRAPTCMSPDSMRYDPNHSTATLETFSTSSTIGNIKANSRPARSAVSVSAALASAKRSTSCRSRTNARTTRMPVSCSRSTRLTVSMRSCMTRKSGTVRTMIALTAMSSTGIATAIMSESSRSCCSAMMTPPIARIGALTSIVLVMSTSICTCCTSLVVRVMSEGAPNRLTSRSEKVPTCANTAPRKSRPRAIATRAPK